MPHRESPWIMKSNTGRCTNQDSRLMICFDMLDSTDLANCGQARKSLIAAGRRLGGKEPVSLLFWRVGVSFCCLYSFERGRKCQKLVGCIIACIIACYISIPSSERLRAKFIKHLFCCVFLSLFLFIFFVTTY